MPGTSREYFTNADHPWIPEYHHDQYAEDIGTSLETQPLSEDEINTDLADQNELPPEMSLCQSFSRAAITEELSSLGMGALGGTSSHEGAKATRGKKKNTDQAKGRHRRKSQLLQADAVDSKTSVALRKRFHQFLRSLLCNKDCIRNVQRFQFILEMLDL
ncbi:uncharacterized protein [Macrobrachium rosenbergii]|uniref:uncharacterized protein n=1 Tax=Macrobrachium rosenbergii TaxID=79674 RepID=UPI0034D5ADBC